MRGYSVVPTVVLGLTCLVACGPSLTFTRRAPSKAREHGCKFDILVVGAFPIHREIGVIELDASCMHGPQKRAGAAVCLQGVRTPSLSPRKMLSPIPSSSP